MEGSGRRWDQTVIKNSKGVSKAQAKLVQVSSSGDIELLGTVVHVLKKTHNALSSTKPQDLG